MGQRGKDAGNVTKALSRLESSNVKKTTDNKSPEYKMNEIDKNKTKVSTVKKQGDFVNKMSHTVTVTRTTTSTTTSALILNTGYLKTFPGLLKVLEVLIAGICMGLTAYYRHVYVKPLTYNFYFSMVTCAFIASFCLLIACVSSLSSSTIIGKSNYELIYHSVMFVLVLISSILLFVAIKDYSSSYYDSQTPYYISAILGLVLSVLYLISTFLAYKTYRI